MSTIHMYITLNKLIPGPLRFYLFVIPLFLLSFLFTPSVPAQDEAFTVSGTITALDAGAGTVMLDRSMEDGTTQSFSFVLSEDIEFFGTSGLEALSAGDDITVDYVIDENGAFCALYLYKFAAE